MLLSVPRGNRSGSGRPWVRELGKRAMPPRAKDKDRCIFRLEEGHVYEVHWPSRWDDPEPFPVTNEERHISARSHTRFSRFWVTVSGDKLRKIPAPVKSKLPGFDAEFAALMAKDGVEDLIDADI